LSRKLPSPMFELVWPSFNFVDNQQVPNTPITSLLHHDLESLPTAHCLFPTQLQPPWMLNLMQRAINSRISDDGWLCKHCPWCPGKLCIIG
jgi:hypothetical protein